MHTMGRFAIKRHHLLKYIMLGYSISWSGLYFQNKLEDWTESDLLKKAQFLPVRERINFKIA